MRRGGPLAAAITATLVWVPVASGDWRGPDAIRDARAMPATPALAVNQRGDALVVWQSYDGIRAASARRGGRFGEPELIPGSTDDFVNVLTAALASDGSAVVAWPDNKADLSGEVVFASTRAPGGGFTPVQVVGTDSDGIARPMVAVRGGRATVAWETGGALVAARARVGEAFRAAETVVELGRPEPNGDLRPALRIDRRGREHYAFQREGIETVVRGRRGRMTGRRVLVDRPVGEFAAAWAGGALGLFWNRRGVVRAAAFGERGRTRARILPKVGGFGPSFAAAPGGHFVVASNREDFGDPSPVFASARVPGQRFTRLRKVRGAVTRYTPAAAVSRSGHALLAWNTPDGRIATATARGDNRFTTGRDFDVSVDLPVLGLDARGRGYLVSLVGGGDRGLDVGYVRYRP